MARLIISKEVERLDDYRYLKRKFDTGYLRQIDKFISIKHRDRWLLVNSFFNRNVLETRDARSLILLKLFSEPLPFIVFLKKLADRFHLDYAHPSKDDVEKIAAFLSLTRTFITSHFVVTEAFNEYAQLAKMRLELVREARFAGCAYIMTSLNCNFRCPDCYIYRGSWEKRSKSTMTPKVFDHLHTFVMQMIPKGIRMKFDYTFYGGEPLLNKPMIAYAAGRIRELERKGAYGLIEPTMSVVTNGSLIDDEVIRMIREYQISIGVSWDGVGGSHDANRVFPDGRGTFKTVLEGINRLEKARVKYGLSWTVGPRNIDAVAKDIAWVVKHLKTRSIFFNILQALSDRTFRKVDEGIFFKKMHRIYDVLRKYGIAEVLLQRYRCSGMQQWQMLPYPFYCAVGGGGQFVMRPDGKIGICHCSVMEEGPQWQTPEQIGDFAKDPIYLRWMARTPVFMKPCYRSCNYFSLCSGGCAYRVEKTRRSMYDKNEDVCLVERFMVERAVIEDYWEEPLSDATL